MNYSAMRDEMMKISSIASRLASDAFAHPIEVGGLGVLAAPSVDNMVARYRARKELGLGSADHVPDEAIEKKRLIKERYHDAIEAGGLGALALPSIGHMVSHGHMPKVGSVEKDAGPLWEALAKPIAGTPTWLMGRGAEAAQTARKTLGKATGVRYPVRFNPAAGLANASQQGGTAFRQAAGRSAASATRRGDALAASIGGL
jgi:hypothetical protein